MYIFSERKWRSYCAVHLPLVLEKRNPGRRVDAASAAVAAKQRRRRRLSKREESIVPLLVSDFGYWKKDGDGTFFKF